MEWMLCSEMLPKDGEYVLGVTDRGIVQCYYEDMFPNVVWKDCLYNRPLQNVYKWIKLEDLHKPMKVVYKTRYRYKCESKKQESQPLQNKPRSKYRRLRRII